MHIVRRIGKILIYSFLALLLLFGILALAVQYPSVQTWLTQKASDTLSEELGADVRVGGVDIDFFKTAVLEEVFIADQKGDTLFHAGYLGVDIGVFELFESEIFLNKITLKNAYVNLYQEQTDSIFNYQFLIDNFAGNSTADSTSKEPFKFGIGKLDLMHLRFDMRDKNVGRYILNAKIHEIKIDADELDFELQKIVLDKVALRNSEITFLQLQKDTSSYIEPTNNTELTFPGIGWTISSDKIRLQNNRIVYFDNNAPIVENAVDFSHIELKELNVSINDFNYSDAGILSKIKEISFNDKSGFTLKELMGNLTILPDGISIEELIINTPTSHLENSTELAFNDFNDLSEFLEKVKIESQFKNCNLAYQDLLLLAPILSEIPNFRFPPEGSDQKLESIIFLEGALKFQHEKLSIDDLTLKLDQATSLRFSGNIESLTTDPFYDLQIANLSTSYSSLINWTQGVELPANLNTFGRVTLSGNVAGSLADIEASNLLLTTQASTRFIGNLKIGGLPDIDRANFNLKIKDFATHSNDLKGFTESPLPPELDSIGLIQFAGNFNGTIRKFDINGAFTSEVGNASTDLKMDFNSDYSNATYSGNFSTNNIDLGKILADTSQFGMVTLQAVLNGNGLSLDSIDVILNGNVESAVFNKYEYKELKVDGHLIQRFFNGKMAIQDENLAFDLQGEINLNDSLPDIDATIFIDTVNLKNLNFYQEGVGFSGQIDVKIKGDHLDNLEGKTTISNFAISSDENDYFDKQIVLEAKQLPEEKRALILNSDFLNAKVEGRFHFGDLPNLVLNYVNDFFPIEELAQSPDSTGGRELIVSDQQFEFDFQLTDLVGLVGVFVPDLEALDSSAFIRGNFDSKEKDLNLEAVFPSLTYNGSTLDSLILKMNGNRKRLRSNLAVRNLNLNNTFYAPYFDLNARMGADTLRFDLAVQDESFNDLFKWGGKSTEMPTDYLLVMDNLMVLNEEDWSINSANQIVFNANSFFINDLIFKKDVQSIAVKSIGEAPINDLAPIEVRFNSFGINEISDLLNNPNLRLSGATNGGFTIIEPKQNLHYKADLRVDDLVLNEQPLGNLTVNASQSPSAQMINILAKLEGENELVANGEYDIAANQFDVKTNFDKLSLVIMDPFLTEIMQDSKGYLSGNFTLKGTPEKPSLNGEITMHNISTAVVMTGARYNVDGRTIKISDRSIDFGNLQIFDASGREAMLSGQVNHQFFDNISFDLRAQTDGLNVLNTKKKDNALYYGRLFASADVQITGTPDLPKLKVIATTLDSSLLHVEPLVSELAVVQEDYVIFDNPNEYEPDSLNLLEQRKNAARGGFDLDLTLIVTPAAKLNIIIDPLTGDELFCTGSGNFSILMNPAGDLDITGTYVIEDGQYSFAYEGLVKRDFEIKKGSSLSFAGDPYDARFDITAVYKTRSTPYELISNESTLDEATLASSKRRTDVEVLMNIDGGLTAPEITFDIKLPKSQGSAVDNLVARKLNDLRDEPTELNKQVFGLLFLNSFIQSKTGAGLSNVGENAALKSVSSLISSQLNRLAGKFVKGVDLTLGFESYKTGGQEVSTVSELQVGLSKQLFNDRLTIQVGGNFNLENSEQSAIQEGGYSAIAGDFVLEYKLNDRGNYLLKVFHKSDYNALLGANSNKTGVGVIFRKNY